MSATTFNSYPEFVEYDVVYPDQIASASHPGATVEQPQKETTQQVAAMGVKVIATEDADVDDAANVPTEFPAEEASIPGGGARVPRRVRGERNGRDGRDGRAFARARIVTCVRGGDGRVLGGRAVARARIVT